MGDQETDQKRNGTHDVNDKHTDTHAVGGCLTSNKIIVLHTFVWKDKNYLIKIL